MLLAEVDIGRLAAGLGLPEDEFIRRYTRLAFNRAQLSLTETPDGACVFLENDRCRVYAWRPGQCRRFPQDWSVSGGCRGGANPSVPLD